MQLKFKTFIKTYTFINKINKLNKQDGEKYIRFEGHK